MAIKTQQVTDALSSVKGLFFSQGSTIFNGLLVVVTISGEQLFRRLSFKCPCAYPQNIYYGGSFIFAPAVALFLVGVLLNSTTWRIMHGCCYRTKRTKHGIKRSCFYWSQIVSQALVAPVAWLFVAFLDGGYYECFRAGDFCHANSTESSIKDMKTMEGQLDSNPQVVPMISGGGLVNPMCVCKLPVLVSTHLRAYSQVVAWMLLVTTIATVLIVILITRCMDRMTFCQNYYVNLYRDIEKSTFEKYARENATELAETNCKVFFEKPRRTKLDWDKISVVPLNEYPHFLNRTFLAAKEEPYFSPLHEWVKDHKYLVARWNTVVSVSTEKLSKAASVPTDLKQSDQESYKPLLDDPDCKGKTPEIKVQ